jgi:hypothetical protein
MVFLLLIYVVMFGVVYVDLIRGVRASLAEGARGGSAAVLGGVGSDISLKTSAPIKGTSNVEKNAVLLMI